MDCSWQPAKRLSMPYSCIEIREDQWIDGVFGYAGLKRAKVSQYSIKTKPRKDLYSKLAEKLERQLKQIKNHNTSQAREKLILLQKCNNQKHLRQKNGNDSTSKTSKITSYHQRPQTCGYQTAGRATWYRGQSRLLSAKENRQEFNLHSPKVSTSQFEMRNSFNRKIEKLKQDCEQEDCRSQKIRDNIETANFYKNLVTKNSDIILSKIL